MAQRIRNFDWSATPLGAPLEWPQSLRSALSICLNSAFPTCIYWGPEMRLLYNDAWSTVPGPRHPASLGQPAKEVWTDIWHIIGPQLTHLFETGEPLVERNQYLPMRRYGRLEETYWDYSFTPIAGEAGEVAGVFNQGIDRTREVLGERRDRLLLQFSDNARVLTTTKEVIDMGLELLCRHLKIGQAVYGTLSEGASHFHPEVVWTDGSIPPPTDFAIEYDMRATLLRGEVWHRDEPDDEPGSHRAIAPAISEVSALSALVVTDRRSHAWTQSRLELLWMMSARIAHEVERLRTANVLRASEERHRLIFEQARDTIITADLNQRLTACNPAGALALGIPVDDIVGRSISEFLSPADFEKSRSALATKLAEGGTTQYEIDVRVAGGRVRRWDVKSSLLMNSDDQPIGLQAIARDVTEQRAFEERQQLLIDELNHRVKNTLATVQALAMQSFRKGRDPEESKIAFQGRLSMLATAHDLLTREKWQGATFGRLAAEVMAPFGDRIDISGPYIALPPKASISLALALHELATNASRYGALSIPNGRVDLHWTVEDGNNLTVTWRETGMQDVTVPNGNGFGLRLVERVMTADLNATSHFSFEENGLVCTFKAVLPEVLA